MPGLSWAMELTIEQVKARLDAGESLCLLDCREDHEWALCRLGVAAERALAA